MLFSNEIKRASALFNKSVRYVTLKVLFEKRYCPENSLKIQLPLGRIELDINKFMGSFNILLQDNQWENYCVQAKYQQLRI